MSNPAYISSWSTQNIIDWINTMKIGDLQKENITKSFKKKALVGANLVVLKGSGGFSQLVGKGKITDHCSQQIWKLITNEMKNEERQRLAAIKSINSSNVIGYKVGQKIKCVDDRYKSKLFAATIKRVLTDSVFVAYKGYPDSEGQWIPRNQWAQRIVISQARTPPAAVSGRTLPPYNTEATAYVHEATANDPTKKQYPKLGKSHSVTAKNMQWPFESKMMTHWSTDDVCDWIGTAPLTEHHRGKMRTIATKNQWNGKLVMTFESGMTLNREYGSQYGINEGTFDAFFRHLETVKNKQPSGYTTKRIESWNKSELINWIKSLDLQKEKKVVNAIQKYDLKGADFAECETGRDLADSLHIDEPIGKMLFKKIKPLKRADQPSTEAKKNDPLPPKPKKHKYYEGQQIECMDGNNQRWYPAIIKEVKKNKVKVGWLPPQWQHPKFDQWITKQTYDIRIRVKTETNVFDAAYSYNNAQNQARIPQAWEHKHVDKWTCNELQEWIVNINLNKSDETHVVKAISEQEIGGEDFNTMNEVEEIVDSFEISKSCAGHILNALNKVRTNSKAQKRTVETTTVVKRKNTGIIGLNNLHNTCFINSVIQGLLQTPPLMETLRTWSYSYEKGNKKEASGGGGGWFSGWGSSSSSRKDQPEMLDAFIFVARAALQENGAVAPRSIVKHLRSSDIKFRDGEQGDALSAVSKMIELLDEDIIRRKKKVKKKKEETVFRSGSFGSIGVMNEDDEEDLIEYNLSVYNPYESPIRGGMHFVERNVYTCLKCGWKEARYDIKEKVLLPLKDHSMTVYLDIYIPSKAANGVFLKQQPFEVLDYCAIETLQYMVFEVINGNEMGIKDMNQISIGYIAPNKKKLLSGWIKECDVERDCAVLSGNNRCVFAVVDTNNKNKKNKNGIRVTTFHVFVDKNGDSDTDKSYLEFTEMKQGSKKSYSKMTKENKEYKLCIYFDSGIHSDKYECSINDKNAIIICFWIHNRASNRVKWQEHDDKSVCVNEKWSVDIFDEFGDGEADDYTLVVDLLRKIQSKYRNYANCKFTKNKKDKNRFEKEYIGSLQIAINYYDALMQNEEFAMDLVYSAFAVKGNKRNKRTSGIIGNISSGFNVYRGTKVMDRGASVKCGKCKHKLNVFKRETKIVSYPQVLIFAIDRFIDGHKFNDVVGYRLREDWDNNEYQLYAVCNHSGGLGYGHYWAFVKAYDDDKWYNANDSSIRGMNPNDAVDQTTAILLMYKKTPKKVQKQ